MNFRFSDEQRLIRSELRDLLERTWPAQELRQAWRSPQPLGALRRRLAEFGSRGLTIPEQFGGAGGSELDLVLVLEEYGRAGVPDSLAVEAGVAVPLLALAGGEIASEWLPRIAAGKASATAGLLGHGYIADADVADLIVLAGGEDELTILTPTPSELVAVQSIDGSRRLFRVQPAEAARRAPLLGAHSQAADRLSFVEAATLLGLSERMLDMAVAHAIDRQQFGQSIGAFQAVKHRLADAKSAVELARPAVYAAAWSLATSQPDRSTAVALAKLFAARAADLVAGHALQVHGGLGFAAEHDLHLYLKRAKALALVSGGVESALETLATQLDL